MKKLLVTSNFFFSHIFFLLNQIIVSHLSIIFYIVSLLAAESEDSKLGMWGKGF